jgi:hypothetical protein
MVFDFVKNGLVKLNGFPDYTQYMVRGESERERERGRGGQSRRGTHCDGEI